MSNEHHIHLLVTIAEEKGINIIVVKRERPIQVRLPNGRTFILRYKRSTPIAITSHVELNRPYKQRSGPKNKPWQHPAAQ